MFRFSHMFNTGPSQMWMRQNIPRAIEGEEQQPMQAAVNPVMAIPNSIRQFQLGMADERNLGMLRSLYGLDQNVNVKGRKYAR